MITLIHGDDVASSRKYFFTLKEKHPDIEIIDGAKVTLTDLAQLLEGGGLFAETQTLFIEQLFSQRKKKEEFAALSTYLEKHAATNTIFLWEGKELDKGALMAIKTATPRAFKLPQTMFTLLDSIKPGNGQELIRLFHQTITATEAEMVFFMLVRQVRLLLAVSSSFSKIPQPTATPFSKGGSGDSEGEGLSPIDEVKRMQPWQKSKLEKQASLFTSEELISLHSKLFLLEIGQKTGQLPNTILTNVDFLFLEI